MSGLLALRGVRCSPKVIGLKPQSQINRRSFHSTTPTQKYFNKVLIVNRGEIACRVMKTCQKLGIKTVAIFSDQDANSKHVKMADEAVYVGPPPTNSSYRNVEAIIKAIKDTGAEAVHPGYGFLSENADFAERIEKSGVVWIGPPSSAMRAMSDKIESKKLAKKAGVNIIPGRLSAVSGVEEVVQIANEIGYPVMVKASAGGGGKGMRVAWNEQEVRDGYKLAKGEAMSSFGSDSILIEKFIDNPRHIEIQIMCDGQGTSLYLNERECSIQRRNQKVLEESPSPFLTPEVRKAMGSQAVALANAVGYKTAGTCEMLVDPQRNFYFLEMNTRLQVEHPVTEMVTGFDLVEMMIKVAAGEKLGLTQADVPIHGWALEARVYAEDPLRNFLPSIGTLTTYKEPRGVQGTVRIDSGVREGDEISIFYDPMISKLITHGKDRKEAIELMGRALDSYVIRGLNHNVCFLRAVMEHPRFMSGNISTKFIPDEFPEGFKGLHPTKEQQTEILAGTAVMHFKRLVRDNTIEGQIHAREVNSFSGVATISGVEGTHEVSVQAAPEGENKFLVTIDGKTTTVDTDWQIDSFVMSANIDSRPSDIQYVDRIYQGYKIQYHGTYFDVTLQTPKDQQYAKHMLPPHKIDLTRSVISPMPGRVFSVSVQPGDSVTLGQELIIIEAMKMQNIIRAQRDGKIAKVLVKQGQDVTLDHLLIEFV